MFGLFLSPTVAVFALTLFILNYIKAQSVYLNFLLEHAKISHVQHVFPSDSVEFQVIQHMSTVLFFLSSSDSLKQQDVLR